MIARSATAVRRPGTSRVSSPPCRDGLVGAPHRLAAQGTAPPAREDNLVSAAHRGWDLTAVPSASRIAQASEGRLVPQRPPARPATGPRIGADPAELQATREGTRVAEFLRSAPVADGSLPESIRADLEPLFGVSLANVRLDTGAGARERTDRHAALAVTEGDRIFFATGAFAPHTLTGRRLLGHELVHVAQQRAHGVTPQRFARVLDYEALAREIQAAVRGPGTDEDRIYRALTRLGREADAVTELEDTYQRLFGEPLMAALRGDLDDEELAYASGLLGKPVVGSPQRIDPVIPTTPAGWDGLAGRLKAAADFQTAGFLGGTDEEAIFAVLQPLSGDAEKIAEIKAAYARITGRPSTALVDMLHDELSGSELAHALELLAVPDQHAGTQAELSRDQVLAVRNELAPGTAVAPPPVAPPLGPPAPLPAAQLWDGRAGAPGAAGKRATLKAQLTTDLINHLTLVMPGITADAASPKIPVTALEGAANAAVEVTDDEYKPWYAVSAATPGQAARRSGFTFSRAAGNLRDATSVADRAATGAAISARSVADWMVRHDAPPVPPGAVEHMAAHDFDPDRPGFGEGAWLRTEVIDPFIAPPARAAQLRLYDQFGFALQPQPGKIVIPTSTPGSSLGTGGATPNLADRQAMWATWHVAVHEYLHNLAHPTFSRAVTGPVAVEGFTEFFTKRLLTRIAPVAHLDKGLVQKVEGGTFAPPTDKNLVGPYSTPPDYAADLTHVEAVATTVPGGENAVRSAYFQGHVEMLGVDPATRDFVAVVPATVDPQLVAVPAGITTLADLADRAGVPEPAIRVANPGLAVGALPPRIVLPGTREHVVVATVVAAGVGRRETAEQIAAQNGVSVAALKKANPGTTWAALTRGQRVLIPRR